MNQCLFQFFVPLLFIFFVACKKDVYKEYSREEEKAITSAELSRVLPQDSTVIYKTAVEAYGNYLSGLLLIKPVGPNHDYRIVFTTETGMKLFDFEFAGPDFRVHYCYSKLNKKPVIKLLRKDFSLMLGREILGHKAIVKKGPELEGASIIKKLSDEIYCYTVTGQDLLLTEIRGKSTSGKEKLIISFEREADVVPSRILIVHKNFDLTISLQLLKR